MDHNSCDPNAQNEDHACPLPLVGDVYMSGELSFMSRDLALYMTNTTLLPPKRRADITIRSHEDVSLSNYVISIGTNVTIVEIPRALVLRKWKLTAEPKWRADPFAKTLWAHTSMYLGGYYKPIYTFRVTWREFLVYWCSGKSRVVVSWLLTTGFVSSPLHSTYVSLSHFSLCIMNDNTDRWQI